MPEGVQLGTSTSRSSDAVCVWAEGELAGEGLVAGEIATVGALAVVPLAVVDVLGAGAGAGRVAVVVDVVDVVVGRVGVLDDEGAAVTGAGTLAGD